ncbi:olfactory receptor-like protein OLF1 [Bombina bombina]|uniref:olfactory receptor-like protein OLF1 n=1 Tax=Bombina bombina TaxID=8345 RepID=UPI00235AE676|nr:olfactory receptor-like protein OLF1 [Bombina bombina]
MGYTNQTFATSFILLGLSDSPYLQVIYFIIFMVMYIITLCGNILLILAVQTSIQLQTPMYFFLSNLSFIDICFSSTIVPKLLVNTISKDRSITLLECASQMFFSLALGATECIILAVMAYDRYAAICRPLLYKIIMNKRFIMILTAASWAVGFINSTIHVLFTFQLPYCRSHHVNHLFCEVPPFLKLSCRDPWLNELGMYISAWIIAVFAFFLTIISYIYIISNVLKIQSSHGRHKTFSTCASHLTVVSLYYGTLMFIYLRPHSRYSPELDKTVPIIYTAVTPMLNPIIYSMRNKDVKEVIKTKLVKKTCFLPSL